MCVRKRVLGEEVEGAEVGWYVRLHVKGVGSHLYQAAKGEHSSTVQRLLYVQI